MLELMKEDEFAKKLASKTSLDEKKAGEVIQAFSETLADYFKKGEKVVISEFGSFYVKEDKSIQFNPAARVKDKVD